MDDREKAGSKPLVEFVKTRGTQVAGRHKDKKERIHEAMCDLSTVVDGVTAQLANSERFDQLQQSAAVLARACSIFLRKTVLGDRGDSKTRLLDEEISRSLGLKFHKLRKISINRKSLDITWNINGGGAQITKLDDNTLQPQAVYNMPITPLEFKISIEWPLSGTASWTEVPTKETPWKVRPEELFDAHSNDIFNCDRWLGQRLVMFDNKGITLKDVIRTIANFEGAHSINVSRLLQIENEMDLKPKKNSPAKNPEIHILNNLKVCGIKYSHIIIIECALYLYKKLIENKELRSPEGEISLPTICLVLESSEDVFSNAPSWLAFDGELILSFGGTKRLISHRIRAVR